MEKLCIEVRKATKDLCHDVNYDVVFKGMFPDMDPATAVLSAGDMRLLLIRLQNMADEFDFAEYIWYIRDLDKSARANVLYNVLSKLEAGTVNPTAVIASADIVCTLPSAETLAESKPSPSDGSISEETSPSEQSPKYTEWLAQNTPAVNEWIEKFSRLGWSTASVYGYLAYNGRLDILKVAPLSDRKCRFAEFAAMNGHLDVVRWTYDSGFGKNDIFICEKATHHGHLNVLEYMVSNHNSCSDIKDGRNIFIIRLAAGAGHLNIIKYLDSIGALIRSNRTCARESAAKSGHHNILKYLKDARGVGLTQQQVIDAAAAGHLEVVQLVCIHDPTVITNIPSLIIAAARHPHVVSWLEAMYD